MFEQERRFVPFSGKRYSVNYFGEVLDISGKVIETTLVENEHMVCLEWIMGKKLYSVGMIVLVSFGRIEVPEYLWEFIEPLYIDNNYNNNIISNLTYRFRGGPLESHSFRGYFYIPFFTAYVINKEGDIIAERTGRHLTWNVIPPNAKKNSQGGYLYVRTKAGNDGVSRIIFMHRALCLAFLRYGSDINKLVVNHLDGSPSNNRLDNLEFTTYSKNNKHAYDNGLRPNASKVVFMKNLTTGVIKRFNSVSECARELGHSSPTFIILRIRDNPTKVYSDMLMFKYDDGSDWPYIDMNNLSVCRMGNGMDIQARNVFTGEIFIFAGTYAGSRITGVNHATILKHVNTNAVIPTDGFNFRFHSNNLDWPQHTERHLMIYRKYPKYPPDGVIMLDTTNNEEIFFVSEKEAAEHLRCNKHHISKSIKTKTLFRERYSLKKFNIRKTLGPSEE